MFKITLSNSAGELDSTVVNTPEEVRAAAIEILSGTAYMVDGDTLTVVEIEA